MLTVAYHTTEITWFTLATVVCIIVSCADRAKCRSISLSLHHEEVFAVRDIQKREVIPAIEYEGSHPLTVHEGSHPATEYDGSHPLTGLYLQQYHQKRLHNTHKSRERRDTKKKLRRRKKKKKKDDTDWKSFTKDYAIYAVVPLAGIIVLVNCYICYFCCLKDGMCCCFRCCARCIKSGAQDFAHSYMPGVRKDSAGRLYCDDLTEEEQQAAAKITDAAGNFGDFEGEA